MTTYTTVIQTSATNFEVIKFNAETSSRVNTGNERKGVLISVWESNEQNDLYCEELAKKMNQ